MNRYLERLPQSISHASFGTSISEVQQESNERYCSKEDYANGHWIRRSNPPSSLEDIRDLYSTTTQRVLKNLTEIHHSADIKIWYRASTPGHVNCQDIQEPAVVDPVWTPHPGAPAWNWHLMEPFNDIWKRRIEEARSTGLEIAYLDVWPMSLQRGDSHLLPPNDCLHFCYQGVVEEWQQFLWQEIVRESVNEDYEIGSPIYL
ncbi:hypothetical protein NliqN6_1424 [Naganishia liquefaciens]|uniref:Trichome birefringence-like C-terminal domain-containing protein n=1 Tax=Naganishia liquefaciens TaxID=104408 RepID=A0A8H3TPU8_9TREE|nr:hypothetical protein NliqN6_1424 [Naganishia liquefaciens]